MDVTVLAEIEELRQMKAGALRSRYRALFGEEPRLSNRQLMFRRIVWHLQARVEGDLGERARRLTCAFVRLRASSKSAGNTGSPEIGSFPAPARCSPASLKTGVSS